MATIQGGQRAARIAERKARVVARAEACIKAGSTMTIGELAKACGVGHTTARTYLIEAGLTAAVGR